MGKTTILKHSWKSPYDDQVWIRNTAFSQKTQYAEIYRPRHNDSFCIALAMQLKYFIHLQFFSRVMYQNHLGCFSQNTYAYVPLPEILKQYIQSENQASIFPESSPHDSNAQPPKKHCFQCYIHVWIVQFKSMGRNCRSLTSKIKIKEQKEAPRRKGVYCWDCLDQRQRALDVTMFKSY